MKTFFKKKVRILFALLISTCFYGKNYAQSTTEVILSRATTSWTVPSKVASIKIQAWGGGGAGGGSDIDNEKGGGGGGGGAYVEFVKTEGLSGIWYYRVGLGGEGRLNNGRPGRNTWINFTANIAPVSGLDGLLASRGMGGRKPANAIVFGGEGGSSGLSFFPYTGGSGGLQIFGNNGSNGNRNVGGRGGDAPNGGKGGARVRNVGGVGNAGSIPGGGGSGAFVNDATDRIGGNGGDGRITLTITFVDAPTASNQTLCSGSTISDLVTSNTLAGATIQWYDQATGGAVLPVTTLLSNKTYYATQTFNNVESDRTAVLVTIDPSSVAGSISGAATVCTGTNNSVLTLSGNTGNITKWQSSTMADFSAGVTDISNTTTSLTAENLTATTYYRAVVKSGVCLEANSPATPIHVKQSGLWNGAVNTDWNNAGNWCGTIPTASTDVTITSEPSNQPLIGTANAIVGSLTIATGASVTITSNMTLNVWGDWTNNGTFTATSGTISFKKAGDQAIGGANISIFNNVSIEGGGSKVISKDIEINGTATFTGGYITTANGSKLIFKAGSSVATGVANDASFAKVQVVKYGTSGFEFPVGGLINGVNKYRPIAISGIADAVAGDFFSAQHVAENPLISANFTYNGSYYVTEGANTLQSLPSSEYWNLNRSTGSIAKANVTIDWNGFPTPDANASMLRLAHFNSVANKWENPQNAGSLSFVLATKKLTVAGVSEYSPFTLGSIEAEGALAALPVTLKSFTAKPTPDNKVSLGWVTSTESVNKGFRIERQAGNVNGKFEQIGFVASKAKDGNSQNTLTYNFTDAAPKVGTASFYRLVQEDLDGKLTYTEVRVVKLNGQSVSMVFPNPSNGAVNISRPADGKKMNIQVIDQSGRIISQVSNITDANYRMNISQSGIYSIKMTYPETGEQSIQRIVVQK